MFGYDAIEEIEKELLPEIDQTDPNSRYDYNHQLIYTISNSTNADNFSNTYNHDNNYTGLQLGQIIKINGDNWYIAGFDCESSIKNNGNGICLIPEDYYSSSIYGSSPSSGKDFITYMDSYIHASLSSITSLRNLLGNHLVNRNVQLGSGYEYYTYEDNPNGGGQPGWSTYRTSEYTWTKADATLLTAAQIGQYDTYADGGEANYKLPLFKYMNYYNSYRYWIRGLRGVSQSYSSYETLATLVYENIGGIGYDSSTTYHYVRPMIYIR